MPTFVCWMQTVWNWRHFHPTASCVLTSLGGASGLLVGIVSATGNASGSGSGILISLIGVVLLGFVIYAGYDTNWFQDWKYNDTGTAIEGHSVARSIGPLILSVAVLSTVVFAGVFYLITLTIGAATRRA